MIVWNYTTWLDVIAIAIGAWLVFVSLGRRQSAL
jgi:hypothetical protein